MGGTRDFGGRPAGGDGRTGERTDQGRADEVRRGDDPRSRLLAAVVEHAESHGLGGLSLRELAAAVGTSHRMLIYHFGSKEGLVVAVIQAVEAAQREALARLEDDPALSDRDAMRAMWRRLADPSLAPQERLFFEMYGQALQGRPGTGHLLEDIVDEWVDAASRGPIERGVPEAVARADARLGVAVVRGLLLDLLATGDRDAVDAALERYVAQYAALDRAERAGRAPVER